MDIKLISTLLGLHFLALITPGPDFFLTLKHTLNIGRKSGIMAALGIGTGITMHVSYCTLGLAILLKTYPPIMLLLNVAGALYLLYLGSATLWEVYQSAVPLPAGGRPAANPNYASAFQQGFYTNLLNPKATLFILGLFSSGIPAGTSLPTILTVGTGIILVTIGWFILVATVFSSAHIRRIYLKLKKPLNVIFGVLFLLAGGVLLIT
jgi:threonine/homoserine/homoserine lactone efflux protein